MKKTEQFKVYDEGTNETIMCMWREKGDDQWVINQDGTCIGIDINEIKALKDYLTKEIKKYERETKKESE